MLVVNLLQQQNKLAVKKKNLKTTKAAAHQKVTLKATTTQTIAAVNAATPPVNARQ